ncbi:hypothetical protein BYT27DRAFT_7214040 [Phlegmacium glaucopus]|nr:hypothetical protein BYT27DRAFT_7214040 [Phlegmacium glaucopus]
MSHSKPQCYTQWAENSFFSQVEARILALDPNCYFPPDKESSFAKTLYYHLSDDSHDKSNKLGLIFFGEICPASMGTMLSAKGNHYNGKFPKLANLEEILEEDKMEGKKNPFKVPPDVQKSVMKSQCTKAKKNLLLPKDEDGMSDSETLHDPAESQCGSNSIDYTLLTLLVSEMFSLAPSIELGAFYPLKMLADHQGDYFQQEHAKLVQLEIEDTKEKLIPPWELYDKLQVVLIETTLVCWHIPDHNGASTTDRKRVYQIQGHCLQVLLEF